MSKPKRILVVVAHPDDETIGIGGIILKHSKKNDDVRVISMTDGVGSRGINKKSVTARKKSADKASKILGFSWQRRFDFDDNQLDKYPLIEIVRCIEKVKSEFFPELVYTHSAADLNIDHRVVSNAVMTAFRPVPHESCKEIRMFEVSSATDYSHETITRPFSPNLFVDISDYWSKKSEALQAYSDEMQEYPSSRSLKGIENLARNRGSQVGLRMAETCQVVRKIEL